MTILSLNHRPMKLSEDVSLSVKYWQMLYWMSHECQMQSLSSLNEFRISKWQRLASELLQMMRNSKTKKNDNFDNFAERQTFDSLRLPVAVRLCLRIRWEEVMVQSTLVHFGVSGAKNDGLADFTKLVIFMTKLIQDKELYALHRESRKVQCFIQKEA